MVERLGFYFDSRACSGCKACQIACQDKHGLTSDVQWRRVYEISGGEWRQHQGLWLPDVFAYNLSISCNHCEKPICVEVCPSQALTQRVDGIVLLDEKKCVGCGYCQWACPYDALQYDSRRRSMTKCTFCADYLEIGKPPACVAACPMRVLEFGKKDLFDEKHSTTGPLTPLPGTNLTQPALGLTPHREAGRARTADFRVFPEPQVHLKERSLIAFTLLSQAAVGAFITLGIVYAQVSNQIGNVIANQIGDITLLAIGPIIVLALLVSLFHLGNPRNAYRAAANLKNSWLSREILFALLFTISGAVFAGSQWFKIGSFGQRNYVAFFAVCCGLCLIFSMANVYRIRTVPTWNSIATLVNFVSASFLLGGLAIGVVILLNYGYLTNAQHDPALTHGAAISLRWIALNTLIMLGMTGGGLFLWIADLRVDRRGVRGRIPEGGFVGTLSALRVILILLGSGMIGIFLDLQMLTQYAFSTVLILIVGAFIIVLMAEIMGRWLFYRSYIRYGI